MRNFRTLDLAILFYRAQESLRLAQHLRSQLSRAAASVVLNLSEGQTRPTAKDRRRFYYMAFGSIKECKSILDLAQVNDAKIFDLADHVAASTYKLCKAL